MRLMSSFHKQLMIGAAVLGFGVGGFALASAATTGSASPSGSTEPQEVARAELTDAQTRLPVVSGPATAVFSGGVAASDVNAAPAMEDDRLTATLTPGDEPNDVCVEFVLPFETHSACVALADIQTGLLFITSTAHGGPIDVIGIVSDDVVQVEIAEQTIPVVNNVWHFVGDAGDDLSFVVSSADGRSAHTN